MVSRRAQIGWSSHGHSAVDVNVYASDVRHARSLLGNNENTDIGKFLRGYLDLEDEVDEVERLLGEKMGNLHGKSGGGNEDWIEENVVRSPKGLGYRGEMY